MEPDRPAGKRPFGMQDSKRFILTDKNNIMKKGTMIILFVTAAILTFGQSRQNKAQILQKCIDLPELQQYFPFDHAGNPKQICILQHGVSFPVDLEVSKFGKSILFMDKTQLSDNGITSYFLFWEFKTDQNSAQVDFVYNFINTDNLPRIQKVNLELQKNNETWTVSKTNIEER
jgi:hypothetical protein